MPELPDVEYFRRYFDATSLHRTIVEAEIADPDLVEWDEPSEIEAALEGAAFEKTDRHGKYMFARVDGAGWLILHYGMSGELEYWEGEEGPPEHTALLVEFEGGGRLAYVCTRRLGTIGWTENPEEFARRKELGPDVFDDIEVDRFLELLEGRRGYLKSALMDQQLMAGIGNEYSDEILFQSRLHPKTKVADLEETERRRVFEMLRETLEAFVEHLPEIDELADYYMLPHRHGDGLCPRCGRELERLEVIGRSAYYCSKCQGTEP